MSQVQAIVRRSIQEVLFELLQPELQPLRQPGTPLPRQLLLLQPEQLLQEAQQIWQPWQALQLASPNLAPLLVQSKQLQTQMPAPTYQLLVQLLNGQQTFWDLNLQMQQSLAAIARSLLPLIQARLVELHTLPDRPSPVAELPTQNPKPLIACIDDSPLIGQTLSRILTPVGYQVVTVTDPLRAIALLLHQRPALIFLDLVMPNVNGYELCGQLRKTSLFQNTPIVILTSHNGIVDRLQARLSGATDFMAKPPEPEKVLAIVRQHLPIMLAS